MDPMQMYCLRWAGPVTMGAVLAVIGYVLVWVENKKRPSWVLTVLVATVVVLTALLWRRALGL